MATSTRPIPGRPLSKRITASTSRIPTPSLSSDEDEGKCIPHKRGRSISSDVEWLRGPIGPGHDSTEKLVCNRQAPPTSFVNSNPDKGTVLGGPSCQHERSVSSEIEFLPGGYSWPDISRSEEDKAFKCRNEATDTPSSTVPGSASTSAITGTASSESGNSLCIFHLPIKAIPLLASLGLNSLEDVKASRLQEGDLKGVLDTFGEGLSILERHLTHKRLEDVIQKARGTAS